GLPQRLHPDQRRAEPRHADDGALRLPQGVPGVRDGLRLGGRVGAVHDHPRVHARDLPLVQRLGLLRGRPAPARGAPMSASTLATGRQLADARARGRFLRRLPLEVGWAIVAFGGSILFIIPFAWMVSTSLKQEAQAFIFPPEWIPS